MEILLVILFIIFGAVRLFRIPRVAQRRRQNRQEYYREYLKSDAWQRKRYVVLKRDNWLCRYCGAKATQVHHTRYAKYNIGKEPIEWLVSVCKGCHEKQHGKMQGGAESENSSFTSLDSLH